MWNWMELMVLGQVFDCTQRVRLDYVTDLYRTSTSRCKASPIDPLADSERAPKTFRPRRYSCYLEYGIACVASGTQTYHGKPITPPSLETLILIDQLVR